MRAYVDLQENKTRLVLNADSSFIFLYIKTDHYLITGEREGESFFLTSGTWRQLDPDRIELTSSQDSISYDVMKVSIDSSSRPFFTQIRFWDIYGDSVAFANTTIKDGQYSERHFGCFHCKDFVWKSRISDFDTIRFSFLGYVPWLVYNQTARNSIVEVRLLPHYKAAYFNKAIFIVKGNSLNSDDGLHHLKGLRTTGAVAPAWLTISQSVLN